MNEQNLAYLKNSLDYLGFGSKLNDVLSSAISRELPKFSLGLSQLYSNTQGKKNLGTAGDLVLFRLNFSRSKESEMYFLNNYEVTLNKAGSNLPIKQVFDLERDNRITALQAYKLLSGNALEKDVYLKAEKGETPDKRKVWFKLDLEIQDAYGNHPLKKFYPEFKFDLSDAIDKYPFKGLDEAGKETMMKLIKNGNLAAAEMILGKKNVPVLITANPQFKGLDVFDKNMMPIRQNEIFPERAEEQQKNSAATAQEKTDITAGQGDDRFPWEKENTASQAADAGMER